MGAQPLHRPGRRRWVGEELKRGRRDDDRAVASGQIEGFDRLQEHRGLQRPLLRLGPAEREHVGGNVDPVDVDPLLQVVQQKASRPAPYVQGGLTGAADEVKVEGPVRPASGVAAEQVPGRGDQAAILIVGVGPAATHWADCSLLVFGVDELFRFRLKPFAAPRALHRFILGGSHEQNDMTAAGTDDAVDLLFLAF